MNKETEKAIDQFATLQEITRQESFIQDIAAQENAIVVINEFKAWSNGTTTFKIIPSPERKKQLLESGAQHFQILLERYVYLLDNCQRWERESWFYKDRYNSVKRAEEMQEHYRNELVRLLDKVEELENKLKKN